MKYRLKRDASGTHIEVHTDHDKAISFPREFGTTAFVRKEKNGIVYTYRKRMNWTPPEIVRLLRWVQVIDQTAVLDDVIRLHPGVMSEVDVLRLYSELDQFGISWK